LNALDVSLKDFFDDSLFNSKRRSRKW
jgi:hypothetical protein